MPEVTNDRPPVTTVAYPGGESPLLLQCRSACAIGVAPSRHQRFALKKLLNKLALRRFVMLGALAMAAHNASAQLSEKSLRDFTACDASFFHSLAKEPFGAGNAPPLGKNGEVAWIKVNNRRQDDANQIQFATPLQAADLQLLGYFDEVSSMDGVGGFYSWGFFAQGTLDEVATKLNPYIKDVKRFRRGKEEYARTEVKIGNSAWLPINTSSGSIPSINSIERVFFLEAVEGKSDKVRVTCSLQGAVYGDLLQTERPDLMPAEYAAAPAPAPVTPADATLRPEVLEKMDAAAPAGSIWRPRFSKAVILSERHGTRGLFQITEEIDVKDGLVYTREIYSPQFNVDRVTLANFIQLRSKINMGRDIGVSLTTTVDLTLPAALTPGDTVSFATQSQMVPEKNGIKPSQFGLVCTVSAPVSAATIFPNLSGVASVFACHDPASTDTREYALLEDIGLVVQTKSKSAYGSGPVKYLRFEVTK